LKGGKNKGVYEGKGETIEEGKRNFEGRKGT